MTEENKKMSGFEKLMAIQTELKAPKGQYNSFGKYNFRSAEDILEAVKPYFAKYKVLVILTDEIVVKGEEHTRTETKDGTTESKSLRTYLKATARFIDCESDFALAVSAEAREPDKKTGMDSSQITGTASSYARKYALNGLFCIDDTKDADTNEYHKQTTVKQATTPKTVEEYTKLIDDCEDEQSINRLFYEWSKVYPKGTADYNSLSNKSFERKKQIVGA